MDIKNLPNIILARNLVRLREERGWTQPEVAGLYGCNPQYISQLESGRRGFGKATIPKLLEVFNVSLEEFLKMPKDMSSQELSDQWDAFIKVQAGPRRQLLARITSFLEKSSDAGIDTLEKFLALVEESTKE